MATTKEELDIVANSAAGELTDANKAFETLRTSGSAEDLVKAANAVTKATRTADKAKHEADTFELVAVYESIRSDVMKHVAGKIDMTLLAVHDVKSVTITVPVDADNAIEADKVSVNTLGKRTVLKATGNGGTRSRYVYGPDKLNSRELVEQFGPDELGAEKTQATLDEPSKHGLTHIADRIANKLGYDKVPA